ncbi:MAG: ATP-grasp domain-containing protein [Anaerolineae bacterium]
MTQRVLLLVTPKTYRAQAFIDAAHKLNVEVVKAVDVPDDLAEPWRDAFAVRFGHVEAAAEKIVAHAATQPIDAILSVDDSASVVAARACQQLGLPHNSPHAAEAARNKYLMRTLLKAGGVQVPNFKLFHTADVVGDIVSQVTFPCVVKPLDLNGSRGVIRADDARQLDAAIKRLTKLLYALDPSPDPKPFLIEDFIPGFEVALEGLLDHGDMKVLALFDKPDPLDGPFFEETIYVTPSRLSLEVQHAIFKCAEDSARALGLHEGPMHAELRVNDRGPWLVEVAGRSIGGLCSQTLRFAQSADVTLEELILRQALGLSLDTLDREQQAGGVMMLPIPGEGLLRAVTGVEDAKAVTGIEDVEITARLNYPIVPLPEGESYLGFIFARGDTPELVEAALREAHSKLKFRIDPIIQLTLNK